MGATASGTCMYVLQIQKFNFSQVLMDLTSHRTFQLVMIFSLRFVADPMKDDPTPKQRITLNWSENGEEGVRNSLKIHNRVLKFKD